MIVRLFSGRSLGWLIVGEAASLLAGFLAALSLARSLGPSAFGHLEFATAMVAWWLILVRGGFDTVVVRESAQAPERVTSLLPVLVMGRLAYALVGLIAVASCGLLAGQTLVCSVLGCVLLLSALAPDLRARVAGDAIVLAAASASRGLVSLGWVLSCVGDGAHPAFAVLGMVLGEAASTIVFYWSCPGGGWSGWRERQTCRAIAGKTRLSLLVSAWRFFRVMVYALDPLLLGITDDPELGHYSAARRISFALLGLCLVVPGSLAGPLASAFAEGGDAARTRLSGLTRSLLWISLPPTLGLWLTGPQWMPILFGPSYVDAGSWLQLLVIRVPILALSALVQTAIFASGRERWVTTLSLGLLVSALVSELMLVRWLGAWGVAWGVLGVELLCLIFGWILLLKLRVSPDGRCLPIELVAGLAGMVMGCELLPGHSAWLRSVVGALGFGLGILAASLSRSVLAMRRVAVANPAREALMGDAR